MGGARRLYHSHLLLELMSDGLAFRPGFIRGRGKVA
jgi:hypothetical protein